MKTNISEILAKKGRNVWTISPDLAVYDAIAMMADKSVGALAVTAGDKLVGIISERDYARKVILKGRSSKETKIDEIMSRDLVTISPNPTVKECMALMTKNKVRHLPVLEGEKLTGMVSIGDLVFSIIDEQKATIGRLESYTRSFVLIGLTILMTVLLMILLTMNR